MTATETAPSGIDSISGYDSASAATAASESGSPPAAPSAPTPPTPTPAPETVPAAKTETPVVTPPKPVDDLEALRAKPATTPTDAPKEPKALREAYDGQKAELQAARLRIKELETGTDAARKQAADEVQTKTKSELERLSKEVEEREQRLRLTDYTKSDEYKESYAKPIADAWTRAEDAIKGVKVTGPDGTERDANLEDVASLCRMSDRDAYRIAAERFGSDANLVTAHRDRIMDLWSKGQRAIQDYKAKAKDVESSAATAAQERVSGFSKAVESIQKEYSDLFGEIEGDKDVNELVKAGNAMVRTAFVGDNLPENMAQEAREQAITKAQVITAARAAGFARQTTLLNRARTEITELKARLAKLEIADPPAGGAESTPVEPSKSKTGADGIDDLPGVDHY